MATHYVEDYEEVTGKQREGFSVTTKVITAPESDAEVIAPTKAETK